ncbi:MAG: trigger factor [Chlorobi bacterium]|nr:trigger factor [Chlorobiota bacterium]MCI0717080.1 trigger factor [Chlorobiota bacterium]
MAFKVNKIDSTKQEVEFEIPYSDLTSHFEKAYKKYQKKVAIPGFRKGKAPISMLKRMYGDLIEQGSLEDVANDVFRDYLKDNHVHPLSEGSLIDMNYEPKSILTFKVKYEVKPEISLNDYKGIEVTKILYNVDDKMIDEEVKYMQSKHVTYENAEKADSLEYVVTLDVQKLDDTGIEIIGQKDNDVRFYLNDPQFGKEFKEQTEGIAVGEERILMLPSQEGLHAEASAQAGKTEKYKVRCKKIDKVVFPELNEEFFSKIYKDAEIKTIDEFRAKVKENLEAIYKNISEQELRNNIVSEMIKLNDVPAPEALVENILHSYIDDLKNQNSKRELPKDFDSEEFHKTKRTDAILQVKWYLIRDEIIKREKIEVTDKDLLPVIESDAKKYNLPVYKLKSIYEKNPDVKYKILDDKLMDFLIKNAKIKEEVKKEEILK